MVVVRAGELTYRNEASDPLLYRNPPPSQNVSQSVNFAAEFFHKLTSGFKSKWGEAEAEAAFSHSTRFPIYSLCAILSLEEE